MQKFELKDICFFDCETTGVPAKGLKWDADFEQFPHVVQLAWSLGNKEKSYIIKVFKRATGKISQIRGII